MRAARWIALVLVWHLWCACRSTSGKDSKQFDFELENLLSETDAALVEADALLSTIETGHHRDLSARDAILPLEYRGVRDGRHVLYHAADSVEILVSTAYFVNPKSVEAEFTRADEGAVHLWVRKVDGLPPDAAPGRAISELQSSITNDAISYSNLPAPEARALGADRACRSEPFSPNESLRKTYPRARLTALRRQGASNGYVFLFLERDVSPAARAPAPDDVLLNFLPAP